MTDAAPPDGNAPTSPLAQRIAELEQEARASREAEKLLWMVLENAPDFISRILPDGTFLFINRLVAGSRHRDVVGRNLFEFVPEASHAVLRACIDRVVQTAQPDRVETAAAGGHGRTARYLTRAIPIVEDGRVTALTLISTDITSLKETEEALRDSEQKLRLALAATGMGLWSWDRGTDDLVCDAAACRILGADAGPGPRTYDEYLARVHADDRAHVAAALAWPTSEPALKDVEHRVPCKDGTTRWVLLKGTVVRDANGRVERLVGGLLDITERRRLEEQVRHAQKMEAIGELAAGIAHNFNNMLAGILPNIELAIPMASPPAAEMLVTAREAAKRAAKMIRELLVFSGKKATYRRQVDDTKAIVRRAVDICRTTFDRAIAIELVAPERPLFVDVDGVQMEQAVLNVLINARDALERVEGRPLSIRIDIDRLDANAEELRGAGLTANEDHARIRISDTGCGMDEETRRRMCEPFFTTKEIGRGTGLGLATTYAIVHEHRGMLSCESKVGAGTRVDIYLPIVTRHAVVVPVRELAPVRGGSECILIADDEPLVRSSVAKLLVMEGYRVLEAADGVVALELLRARHAEIDLVILDNSMPKLSGRELLEALRVIAPRTKVIGFSGGIAGTIEGVHTVLDKPTDAETLLRTVREVLDA